jgi:uncharacterized protein (TIGR02598 family)
MKKPKYPSRSAGAFSLTEVVLALGVMAFGLVGLVGGLSNSLQSQTGAERDTRLAGISQRILSEYRAQSFDLLVAGKDAAGANRVSPCYFTADGEPTAAPAGGGSALGAYYQCEIERVIDAATQSPNGSANLLNVKMTLRWPYQNVSRPGNNTRVLHATVARY